MDHVHRSDYNYIQVYYDYRTATRLFHIMLKTLPIIMIKYYNNNVISLFCCIGALRKEVTICSSVNRSRTSARAHLALHCACTVVLP